MSKIVSIALLVILSTIATLPAQTTPTPDSSITLFDYFFDLDVAHVIVNTDLDSLDANKFSTKEQAGLFTVTLVDSTQITFATKVSVRGKFRRIKCEFPPLRLNFRKKDLKALGLKSKRDNYKLVTHCKEAEDGRNAVLREYLVYQLYQELTDKSYRVKLFPIIYKDVDSENKIENVGFLIESTKELTKRLGGKENKDLNPHHTTIDPMLYEQIALFQYMVGNKDMNLKILRNVLMINSKDNDKMVPVAYDFDFAPFVQASYVYAQFKDKRDVERIYLGFEDNQSYLNEAVKLFLAKKERFYEVINNLELLPKAERRECINYLQAFYDQIEKKDFKVEYQVE